jgi:hypothetical protein
VSYRLVYTRRAVRDIQGLDPGIKERLGRVLLRYAEDPLSHAERLTESELGSYRFQAEEELCVLRRATGLAPYAHERWRLILSGKTP